MGQREETTEELSERVLARLRREYSLVSSEVWVDDVHRVDFVGFRPARNSPFPSSIERGEFVFVEVKSCMNDFKSGHGLTFRGDANWLVCPPDLAQTLYEIRQLPKDAAGRYFATFLCTDVPTKNTPATDREVGIDLGVETLATLSDGRKIGNPRHLKKYERKLAREQRRLSRRKGARRDEKPIDRYLKQRKRVARIHAKIADARTDALHKVTTMLADENQVLCMEDLNAKGMVRNRRLAKAVSDASFGEFARLLEYKCAERGRTLVKVGRFYPSSKTCSACGHRLDALPLSVRVWDCPACGAHHDRDVNAARNILAEGKRVLSNTEGTAGHAGTVAAVPA